MKIKDTYNGIQLSHNWMYELGNLKMNEFYTMYSMGKQWKFTIKLNANKELKVFMIPGSVSNRTGISTINQFSGVVKHSKIIDTNAIDSYFCEFIDSVSILWV